MTIAMVELSGTNTAVVVPVFCPCNCSFRFAHLEPSALDHMADAVQTDFTQNLVRPVNFIPGIRRLAGEKMSEKDRLIMM